MLVTQQMLAAISAEAGASPRRRKNRNFHRADDAAAHRLLNALEPDSYVRPHRHLDPSKDETIIAVRGRFGVVEFEDDGRVRAASVIAPGADAIGIDIAHGTFHTVLALEPGSVFFEAKAGPYVPIAEAEKAHWAPAEGETGAPEYLARMRALFT